jgi:hypothetical protein
MVSFHASTHPKSVKEKFMSAGALLKSDGLESSVQSTQSSAQKSWKDLYVAALLEGNESRIPRLIADAEGAIVERARELFATAGDHIQEEEALDDALYALHALKSCLAIHGRFAEAA